nr:MAG TPA: hypothetical protein [Caudoviricetes sp.]
MFEIVILSTVKKIKKILKKVLTYLYKYDIIEVPRRKEVIK